jgi:hypothetical protein
MSSQEVRSTGRITVTSQQPTDEDVDHPLLTDASGRAAEEHGQD